MYYKGLGFGMQIAIICIQLSEGDKNESVFHLNAVCPEYGLF